MFNLNVELCSSISGKHVLLYLANHSDHKLLSLFCEKGYQPYLSPYDGSSLTCTGVGAAEAGALGAAGVEAAGG